MSHVAFSKYDTWDMQILLFIFILVLGMWQGAVCAL